MAIECPLENTAETSIVSEAFCFARVMNETEVSAKEGNLRPVSPPLLTDTRKSHFILNLLGSLFCLDVHLHEHSQYVENFLQSEIFLLLNDPYIEESLPKTVGTPHATCFQISYPVSQTPAVPIIPIKVDLLSNRNTQIIRQD